jgi:hypothetical protein
MRTFELNIFIDRPQNEVYDHVSEPINMIGLLPRLGTIDIMKEQKDANGVVMRPFYTLETFRWAGIPVFRNRIYTVIHLTRPKQEMEFHVFIKPNIKIVFRYFFNETDDQRTHLIQRVNFEKVNKLLEGLVFQHAITAQRAFLTNLKIRLEKN